MSDYEAELVKVPNLGHYLGPRNDHGERHGAAQMSHPNHDFYDGEYANGLRDGRGTYTWAYSGVSFDGSYGAGARNGQGTMTWPDGATYVGAWVEGRREGQGKYTWPNGDSYEGSWVNDAPNGTGKYVFNGTGVSLEGEFVDGSIVKGRMVFAGGYWEGGFRLSQPFGAGRYVVNGFAEEGEFVEPNPPQIEEEDEEEPATEFDDDGEPLPKPEKVERPEPLRRLAVVWVPKSGVYAVKE